MNANTELPHPRPRALHIDGRASGRTAPTSERMAVFAAVRGTAQEVREFLRQVFADMKIVIRPIPNTLVLNIRTI